MSLFFNMLSRLVIAFLPRSKHILISWLQSPSAVIWKPKKIKPVTVSPSIYHEVMGLDAMILVFWMLSCKPAFSLSSFFHQVKVFTLNNFVFLNSTFIKLLNWRYVHACSVMSNSVIQQTAALQAPLSIEFPGKSTGMGCHFLLQGIFLTPGIKPKSLAYPALAGIVFTTSATRETPNWRWNLYKAASDTTRWWRAQVLEPHCCVHILAALFASSVTRCKLIHLPGHQCSHLWNEAVNSTQVRVVVRVSEFSKTFDQGCTELVATHSSCLENPTDRKAWRTTVHGVTKSQTRLKQLSTHSHMCWTWLLLAHKSLRMASVPKALFSDITCMAWHWSWWEYLHHRN